MAIKWKRVIHSISTRVILIGFVVVLFGTGTRMYVVKKYMSKEVLATARSQQLSLAQDEARELDQKFQIRQKTLQRLARSLPTALIGQPALLLNWLKTHDAVLPLFTQGIQIEDAEGLILAQYPPWGSQVSGHAKRAQQYPIFISKGTDVFAAQSTSIGLAGASRVTYLQGNTSLLDSAMVERQIGTKPAERGGYFLIFPSEKKWLEASYTATVRQQVLSDYGNLLITHAITSKLDTGTSQNAQGVEEVWGRAPVPGTNWLVVVHRPVDEVMQVVDNTNKFIFSSLPGVVLIYLLMAWIGMLYTLRPLVYAADHADRMTQGKIPLELLPVVYQDELGDMTLAFNRLISSLKEQKELAESAALAKSRFLAAASHDLRQPMHALSLYLGMLASYKLPVAAEPVMQSLRTCAQTMDQMFLTMLDISRLDASVMKAEISVFPIATVMNKIQLEFVQQAREKNLELHTVPSSAHVRSDPELLERILRNLVSNAVRYTRSGNILVGCRRHESGLTLGVYDTGPGIAANQQQTIFDEFYQIGNPERDRTQGLGLGLAIVKRLAHLLDAPISLQSKVGRGSVFSIKLETADPEVPELIKPSPIVTFNRSDLAGTLISVIDDERLILDATSKLLEQWGCSVVSATSGKDMIDQFRTRSRVPDVIVCDYRLRDSQNGIDVINMLRTEFNLEIPAILVTGDTSPQRIQEFEASGLVVLHKPVADQVLRDAIVGLLERF